MFVRRSSEAREPPSFPLGGKLERACRPECVNGLFDADGVRLLREPECYL